MSNTFGRHLKITLFGESHGPAIGAVLDGLPGGVKIDEDYIASRMQLRRAVGTISTARQEADQVHILSGVKDGYSEGTPIALVIDNSNVHSKDYSSLQNLARPGHADYAGHIKYDGFEDPRGGGHFSGRLTAPITACGAIVQHMLAEKGIQCGSHIQQLHGIDDLPFDENHLAEQIAIVNKKQFAVLDETAGKAMQAEIEAARNQLDSVGGILETAVINLPAGLGEPEFDSIESQLAHGIFSIPAVKGISFGEGFGFAGMKGSQANDAFCMKDGKAATITNHNGGINGGITNGMPVVFHTVIKPTPSIAQEQKTINFVTGEETKISIHGRHDPAIIHRARVVVDSVTCLVMADFLMERFGREYFHG
ncbi:MAG: chorismate synthase [Lactimicrobium sp.]|jgi:chorismate synthase|uniref:chorismate synthase n=1 Tax=Lactimicrobium sp. TaxID=2563780 RepID=UPI002F35ED33